MPSFDSEKMACTWTNFSGALVLIVLWVGAWGMIEHALEVYVQWHRPVPKLEPNRELIRFFVYVGLFLLASLLLLFALNSPC